MSRRGSSSIHVQFGLRSIFAATFFAAILAFIVGQVFMPNWDLRAWYAGYGEQAPDWAGGRGSNQVSYSLGVACRGLWHVAAWSAIATGTAIAAICLSRAKG